MDAKTLREFKGQSNIMEYIFLTLFILIMIVAMILFLSWFQMSQFEMKGGDIQIEKAKFLMNYMINSPYLAEENSLFDDSKLTSLLSLEDYCDRLDGVFGLRWSLKVDLLTSEDGCFVECTEESYPCCGSWTFCERESKGSVLKYVIPVNVLRKINNQVHLAKMEVSVYEK